VVASIFAGGVSGSDARMAELRRSLRLALEPLEKLRILRGRLGKDLDRDAPSVRGILGKIHGSHPSLPEFSDQEVGPELGTAVLLRGHES
jgi:hypothetical protein